MIKPRILVLTSTYPRTEGDNEPRFVADLCSELATNFDITVLTQSRPGAAKHEARENYEIFRFRYAPKALELLSEKGGITTSLKNNKLLWLLIPLFVFFQVLSVRRHLKSNRYFAIHAHWLIPQGLAAGIANTIVRNPVPLYCTGHGGDIFGLKGKVLSRIKKWIIDQSACVTVVSQSLKSYLQTELKVDPNKVLVIPMGTNLSEIFTPRDIDRKAGQIAFVGRLVEKKGLKYLIEVVPKLASRFGHLKLIVAGAGPDRPELEELTKRLDINQYVEFIGSRSHKQIARLYSSSELCVFPFVQATNGDMEGFGLVVVEAMGCKCPVISGDVPAVKDIVTHKKTGIICEPRNSDQFAQTIIYLLENQELRTSLAKNAYLHVNENFSWEIIGKRYAALFKVADKHSQ